MEVSMTWIALGMFASLSFVVGVWLGYDKGWKDCQREYRAVLGNLGIRAE